MKICRYKKTSQAYFACKVFPYSVSRDVLFARFNVRYVYISDIAEMTKVSKSEIGIEYSTPSKPNQIGSNSAKPTPNKISRTIESIVDSIALPSDCK